ncbi:putative beta-D-xylosidase 5 [Acorus gramineus]|uniref:Beta-D-xylosidase 5 n=1 Tax=Acorus gramineus TaxID=55184 RepID=A0AAV9BSV0_ACOGR|nr:putative beta-D-xylosidase 5 [Acorus gramineus]
MGKGRLVVFLLFSCLWLVSAFHVCDPERYSHMGLDMSKFAFCDKSLPFNVRAKDLVNSMTLVEKALQLGNQAGGVPRLGLPLYEWWSEALHGVSKTGPGVFFNNTVPGATNFPIVLLSTASFNETLWKTIGQVVSTEARAMHNLGMAGLTFWSPNVNVIRDPRWGRIQETPGEDPYTVGRYAVNFVRGLQDVEGHETADDPNSRPLKVSSCCKHYTAYDVDNWNGVDRFHFDAQVTEQDMVETFLRPFEMCVKEGDVNSVMCSFNKINGIPSCADPKLLSQTIRGDWGLHGYIVSDCDSIEVMYDDNKWLNGVQEEQVASAMKAGLDMDCGVYYQNWTVASVEKGKMRETDIDKALINNYVTLLRLGYFDGAPGYDSLGKDDVCSKDHIELAREAARQGIVLLKNDNVLPLTPAKFDKIALVGPHANATDAMTGNYAGIPCNSVSPLMAISGIVKSVDYEVGCQDVSCNNDTMLFPAMEAARKADATIIFVGIDNDYESEGHDRYGLHLPGYQTQLINQVAIASSGPVVMVMMCAGGIDISFAQNNPNIHAIVWAGYPGEQGGPAIADVLFGDYNPGGRLPITWYKANYTDAVPMTSMQLRPNDELGYPGRTYKFFNGSTVYPFGYGLSYTQFSYNLVSAKQSLLVKLGRLQHCHDDLDYVPDVFMPPCRSVLVDDMKCEDVVDMEVQVSNTGARDGSDVVMVYSRPPTHILGMPQKQVIGFQRVFVRAGETETAKFSLNACKSFGVVDKAAYLVLPSGTHTIEVGSGSGSASADGSFTIPFSVDLQKEFV